MELAYFYGFVSVAGLVTLVILHFALKRQQKEGMTK